MFQRNTSRRTLKTVNPNKKRKKVQNQSRQSCTNALKDLLYKCETTSDTDHF